MTEMAGIEYIQDPLPGMRLIPRNLPPEEERHYVLICTEECPHVWEECWEEGGKNWCGPCGGWIDGQPCDEENS